MTMQVARRKKQDNPILEFIRNTSCNSGWLRIAVHILFGTLIVISFVLIVLMALATPRRQNEMPQPRCRPNHCRVICNETPYYGSYQEQIINAISEVSLNCKRVVLQLNEPTFRSGRVPEYWLSEIHSNIQELIIFGGNIKYISPNAFMTTFGNNLNTLILEKIEISFWQYDMLLGLSNLERFRVIDCIFGTIEEKAIKAVDGTLRFLKIMSSSHWDPFKITGSSHSSKLKVVDFSSNNFEYNLKNISFSKINHCQVLFLNSCKIKTIGPGTFDYLENIEVLYLNNNHLITIPVGLFDKILPLKPRIALQDNLWHCNCSVTDLRKVFTNDLLIVDPICRFPGAAHGVSFTDVEGICQNDSVSDTRTANNNSVKLISDLQLYHNVSKAMYMDNTCHDIKKPIKVISYKENKCVLNRISNEDMSPIYYSINHNIMSFSNDWIKPLYAVEYNPYSMVEIAASEELGLGLLWFHSSCLNEIYCVNIIPSTLKIYNIYSGVYYVFCPFNLSFGTILTEKCTSYDLYNFQNVNMFSEKTLTIVIVVSIGCLLGGAITVYLVIHKNPSLLKGNKRVIFVKHKSVEALILPSHIPKINKVVSEPSTITKHVFEKQIFLMRDNLNTLSPQNFLRSISMRSSDSNEAGYISPLQPTEEQLSEWRSNQIVKQLNDTVNSNSETLSKSLIYDRESLPHYYGPIHSNERIYEVLK